MGDSESTNNASFDNDSDSPENGRPIGTSSAIIVGTFVVFLDLIGILLPVITDAIATGFVLLWLRFVENYSGHARAKRAFLKNSTGGMVPYLPGNTAMWIWTVAESHSSLLKKASSTASLS